MRNAGVRARRGRAVRLGALLIGVALAGRSAMRWAGALGLGLALALSSTALVLPIAGTQTPVGRAALRDAAVRGSRAGADHLRARRAGAARRGGLAAARRRSGRARWSIAAMLRGRPLRAAAACSPRPRGPRAPSCSSPLSLLVVIVASLATAAVGPVADRRRADRRAADRRDRISQRGRGDHRAVQGPRARRVPDHRRA